MPRGVRKTLVDKLYDLATTVTVNEFVTAVAELYAVSLKDNSHIKLHEIFGEMNVRAQLMLGELKELEAEQAAVAKIANRKKPGPKPKPKALAQINKRVVKRAPRKAVVRRRKAA